MIVLHGFGSRLGLPEASPFVLKVDAYLRMTGIPYERESGLANMKKAPKGKLPFIVDDGQIIADSSFILRHLQNKHSHDIDDHLSDEQKAIGFLVQSTLEEKLYWCSLYFRWVDDAGWAQVKHSFFANLPMPLGLVLPSIVRRDVRAAALKQGIARHSADEIIEIARDCLASISILVADNSFLFGDKACSVDASLYAFLAQHTLAKIDTPINSLAQEYPNLLTYSQHFQERYYKE